jgi:hypothetical protein
LNDVKIKGRENQCGNPDTGTFRLPQQKQTNKHKTSITVSKAHKVITKTLLIVPTKNERDTSLF